MEPKPSDEKIEKLRMQLAEKALADLITVWRIPATLMICHLLSCQVLLAKKVKGQIRAIQLAEKETWRKPS